MGCWSRAAWVFVVPVMVACGPTPEGDFNAWVARARDSSPVPDTGRDAGGAPEDGGGHEGPPEVPGTPGADLGGSFLLVFVTQMKVEPSRDVRLDLVQSGRIEDGNATVSGTAVAAASPDVTLGAIPAAAVGKDGRFRMVIRDFVIPPDQEPLLPDGGTAEMTLDAVIVDADRFCGPLDFHLLTPFDLHQAGSFGAYRVGAIEPGGAGCE